jgi:hypothetical protein
MRIKITKTGLKYQLLIADWDKLFRQEQPLKIKWSPLALRLAHARIAKKSISVLDESYWERLCHS